MSGELPNAPRAGQDSATTVAVAAAAAADSGDDGPEISSRPSHPYVASVLRRHPADAIEAQLRRVPDPASPFGIALATAQRLLVPFGSPELAAEQERLAAGG